MPWVIGLLGFFLGPLIKTFYYSLFNMTLESGGFTYDFMGIDNFKYLLTVNPEFNQYLLNALMAVARNVPIQIFISLFVAILLNGKYKGRGLFRLIFFVPIILATGITDINLADVNVIAEKSQSFVNFDVIVRILYNSGIPFSVIGVQSMCYNKSRDYGLLASSPVGSLQWKLANEVSKKVLFVAICRTLGIPARLNPVNDIPQYYDGKEFVNVTSSEEQRIGKTSLCLEFNRNKNWCYFQTWTIGRLENGNYKTLDYSDEKFGGLQEVLNIEPGEYRIITANRSANGDIQAAEYYFDLSEGEDRSITLHQKEEADELWTKELELPELLLEDDKGDKISLGAIAQGRKSVLIWLEEGKEPTEHILNEILEQQEYINNQVESFSFILQGKSALSNKTLSSVLSMIPGIHLYYDDFGVNIDKVAKLLNTEPDKLPFVIVTNENNNIVYTSCGYNVGSVKQILKTISFNSAFYVS